MTHATFPVLVKQIRLESAGTASFELTAPYGQTLPDFTPGAHINVYLPSGLVRSYSLLNSPIERATYRIAVKREMNSRGGSAWLHDAARVGMTLKVSPPMNNFALVKDASLSVLVAGGIGITPIMSMIAHLTSERRPWELHYCARSLEHMAFTNELESLVAEGNGTMHRYLDDHNGKRLDINALVQSVPHGAHLYCCGPTGMLDGFIDATQQRDPDTIHFERFTASQEASTEGGFDIHLARDGRTLTVPEGKSILDTLLDAGLDVPYACTQGICGSCITKVVQGTPDHRDECLSDEQRDANDVIIICRSGSRSATLTLDL